MGAAPFDFKQCSGLHDILLQNVPHILYFRQLDLGRRKTRCLWKTMDVHQQRAEVRDDGQARAGSRFVRCASGKSGISCSHGISLAAPGYEQHGVAGDHRASSRRPQLPVLRARRRPWSSACDRVCGSVIRTGERASCGWCWSAARVRRAARSTGFCFDHGLIKECDQHPLALQRFERSQPKSMRWQMDSQGPKGWPQAVMVRFRCSI